MQTDVRMHRALPGIPGKIGTRRWSATTRRRGAGDDRGRERLIGSVRSAAPMLGHVEAEAVNAKLPLIDGARMLASQVDDVSIRFAP